MGEAFTNDDSLGERGEAGLGNKVDEVNIKWVGPKPPNPFQQQQTFESIVLPGQKLSDISQMTGVPIKYSCMNGSCGLCDVLVDGQRMPACTTTAAARDMTIEFGSLLSRKKAARQAAGEEVVLEEETQGVVVPTETLEQRLQRQLAEEMAEEAANKKGGWPFG